MKAFSVLLIVYLLVFANLNPYVNLVLSPIIYVIGVAITYFASARIRKEREYAGLEKKGNAWYMVGLSFLFSMPAKGSVDLWRLQAPLVPHKPSIDE